MAIKFHISLAATFLVSSSVVAIATMFAPPSLLSQANAQMSDQEFQMGRAREACTAQAKKQGLNVNRVVSTVPVNGSGGVMIGSNVTLNVTRHGQTYDVRCDYTNNSRTAKISSTVSPPQSQTAIVNVDSLNIRARPGTDKPVLYRAPYGTEFKVLGQESMGDSVWYKVQARSTQYPQSIGFAYGPYLTLR